MRELAASWQELVKFNRMIGIAVLLLVIVSIAVYHLFVKAYKDYKQLTIWPFDETQP